MNPLGRLWEILGVRHSDAEYAAFWMRNSDRVFMASTIYPIVSAYLQKQPSRRLLEIGVRWYTRRTRRLIPLAGLEYAVVDPVAPPPGLEADRFYQTRLQSLPSQHPELRGHFDIIVSFGVLGFYPMDREECGEYLGAVTELLKDDGFFILKLDLTRLAAMPREHQLRLEDTFAWFQPATLESLAARTFVEDSLQRYEFCVLQKTSRARSAVAPLSRQKNEADRTKGHGMQSS